MKWVTREKAKVDRIVCPWLIKNFIDKEAEFLYVPADQVLSVAEKEGAISFDAPSAKFTHTEDGKCTFEVLVEHYKITDPAIQKLAKVVHGADVPKDIAITPESAGLQTIAEGFRIISKDDHENIKKQFAVYDALYAYFKNHAESL
ncbi:MAG TPA: chromate resistance protein ChrB domain-containing protein [Bacteroidia bacterium]|nr:chromate resistance protein ChrB domain-containing protein [Bacteroidia bacterium]